MCQAGAVDMNILLWLHISLITKVGVCLCVVFSFEGIVFMEGHF